MHAYNRIQERVYWSIIIGSDGITLDGGWSCSAGVCSPASLAIQGPRMTGGTDCTFPIEYSTGTSVPLVRVTEMYRLFLQDHLGLV